MTTKEKILEHIRVVCDLKRLEFGCQVIVKDKWLTVVYNTECLIANDPSDNTIYYLKSNDPLIKEYWERDSGGKVVKKKMPHKDFELNMKIIGLPVELNHLLLVISKKLENADVINTHINEKGNLVFRGNNILDYDLSKSVSENLDNPELLKLVAELLNIK